MLCLEHCGNNCYMMEMHVISLIVNWNVILPNQISRTLFYNCISKLFLNQIQQFIQEVVITSRASRVFNWLMPVFQVTLCQATSRVRRGVTVCETRNWSAVEVDGKNIAKTSIQRKTPPKRVPVSPSLYGKVYEINLKPFVNPLPKHGSHITVPTHLHVRAVFPKTIRNLPLASDSRAHRSRLGVHCFSV